MVPEDAEEYTLEGGTQGQGLTVDLYAVALVRLDSGAEFGTLRVESDNGLPTSSVLYIDLNRGQPGDENRLNITGFQNENVYFVTKRNLKVRLKKVRQFFGKVVRYAIYFY